MDDSVLALDQALIDRLHLAAAARAEGESHSSLLPRGPVDAVLRTHPETVASLLSAQLTQGLRVQRPEVILASKTRGRRPLAVLSAWERVLYRALVAVVAPLLPPVHRGNEEFESFKMAPLEHDRTNFVVMADIASCYQYIDHGLMKTELVNQTGDPHVAEALAKLLGSLMDHRFGLPQNRPTSDQLAETVLSLVDRRLKRRGFAMWRYSDDYRFSAEGRADAHRMLETLEHELGRIGLVVNEEKTSIRTAEHYRRWAEAVAHRIAEAESEFDFDFADFIEVGSGYEEEDEEDAAAEQGANGADRQAPASDIISDGEDTAGPELPTGTAENLLEQWRRGLVEAGVRSRYGPDSAVDRTIVAASLRVLGAANQPTGLEYCEEILNSDPSLTPQVSRYLTRLMAAHEDDVDRTLDQLLEASELYISPWQSLWLMQPMRESTALTEQQVAWLETCSRSESMLVVALAGEVRARQGAMSADHLLAVFDDAPFGVRPNLVAAIAVSVGDPDDDLVRLVTDGRPLFKLVAEEALRDA